MTRRGLGRGLDALLTSTEGQNEGLRELGVDEIQPNPYQVRSGFNESDLADLAASIRVHGLIQPIVVSASEHGYRIIAGERRWRAARAAGLARVPVVVRQAEAREMLALAIIENVQRADLDAIEAAQAFSRLMQEFGLTQAEVAELVGKSRSAIANAVRLLGLSADVRALVSAGHLTEGHGRALLMLEGQDAQLSMARKIVARGWTVRQTEEAAREASRGARARSRQPRRVDPNTAAAERALEGALGTRVEIKRRGQGGRLIIHFYSAEELDGLYERLVDGG